MVAWGKKRLQVEALRSRIVEMVMAGMTLPSIHKQLSDAGTVEINLRSFQRYAAEIRDEGLAKRRAEGGPKVLTPDFSKNSEPPARKPQERAAGRPGQSRPGPTPVPPPAPARASKKTGSFVIEDVFSKEFGEGTDFEEG